MTTSKPDLRALEAAATKGPWREFASIYGNDTIAVMKGNAPPYDDKGNRVRTWPEIITWSGFDGAGVPKRQNRANAALIVAMRNELPGLLDAHDERDALAARIAVLEVSLEPFAQAVAECDDAPDDMAIGDASYETVTVAHCRRAMTLLTAEKGERA